MKKQLLTIALAGLTAMCVSAQLYADESAGSAEVECSNFGKKKAFNSATEKAKEAAIKNWMQSNPDNYINFDSVRDDIFNNLNRYTINAPRVVTARDKDRSMCLAEVVLDLDVLALKKKLLDPSKATQKQGLTFVFVAREQATSTRRSENTTGNRDNVAREMGRDSSANSERQTRSEERTTTEINSQTQSNEQATWRTNTVKEVDATVRAQFIRAGYRVAEPAALISPSGGQFNPKNIQLGYSDSGDIEPTVIDSSIQGLKYIPNTPVKFLATASLDVGLPQKDSKRGLYTITVNVNGKAFNIDEGSFFTSGTCNELRIGEGPNLMVAKHNALTQAAEACANAMIGQMSGNNIR